MNSHWRKRVGLLLALTASACAREGSVGTQDCVGDRIRCERLSLDGTLQNDPGDMVSTKDLPEIHPTRQLELPIQSADLSGAVALSSDAGGQVWLFAAQADGISVMTLDESGAVLERSLLAPPKGADPSYIERTIVAVPRSGGRPVLLARWPQERIAQSPDQFTHLQEWIEFGATPADVLQRVEVDEDDIERWVDVTWDEDGNAFVLTLFQSIEMYDPQLRLVWKQTALHEPSGSQFFTLAKLDAERLAVFELDVAGGSDALVYTLDRDGTPTTGGRAMTVLEGQYLPVAQSTAEGALLIDSTVDGDIVVLRTRSERLAISALTVVREDYRSLVPDAKAIDRAGNAYFLSWAGGRQTSDQHRIVCRAPVEGSASCARLVTATAIDGDSTFTPSLAAADGGRLWMTAGDQLLQIDFEP